MLVIDTNILAHLLIAGDWTDKARALWQLDPDWRSEPFVLVELANVLITHVRVRGLSLHDANEALTHAKRLVEPGLHTAEHEAALVLASQHAISAYDARFLVVARSLGARLVTEDAKLRKAVPALTQSLDEALAGFGAAQRLGATRR